MSSEIRVIRPFDDATETQEAFETGLWLKISVDDEEFDVAPGTTARHLEPRALLRSGFFLCCTDVNLERVVESIKRDCIERLKFDIDDIRVVVSIRNRYLKRVEIVDVLRVSELKKIKNLEIESDLRRSIHNGWTLTVALVLASNLDIAAGRASRKGSWLAKVEFQIASPREGVGFTPLPLTDVLRTQFKLGAGATRYALLKDGISIVESSTVDDLLEYYVDETLLVRLSSSPSSSISKLEQVRIFLDAASFVVAEASRVPGFESMQLADVEDTIIFKFLVLLAGDSKQDQREWLVSWQQSPSRVVAGLEDACDLKKYLDDVVGEIS